MTIATVNNGGASTADSGSEVNDRFNELVAHADANHRTGFDARYDCSHCGRRWGH